MNTKGMPTESEYVDDVDFIDESHDALEIMLPEIKSTFKDWNLYVNESKTEFCRVYIADKHEEDQKGNLVNGNEP